MELIKKDISYYDLVLDKKNLYEEAADAIVPDLCPDVLRIVSVNCSAFIKDENVQNERNLVSGVIKTSVMYIPEDTSERKIIKLNIPINFAHIEELPEYTEGNQIISDVKIISAVPKIINPRKISVSCQMELLTQVYSPQNINFTEDIKTTSDNLQVLKKQNDIRVATKVCKKDFSMYEDLAMNNNIKDIIMTQAKINLIDKKPMANKMLLRGDIEVSNIILNSEDVIQTIKNTIGFNQIFDIDGITENSDIDVDFKISSLDCQVGQEALSVSLGINCFMIGYENFDITTINDLYDKEFDLSVDNQVFYIKPINDFKQVSGEVSESISCGMKVSNIISSSCVISNCKMNKDGLDVSISCSVLYTSDDNEPYSVNKSVSVSIPVGNERKNVMGYTVTGYPAILNNDSIDLKFQVHAKMYNADILALNDIKKITQESAKDKNPKLSMVLKYVTDENSLWNIAKEYNTTMQHIQEANSLPKDSQKISKQMLVIPIK